MPESPRFPAMVIRTREADYRKPQAGGGEPKLFGDIEEARQRLIQQCEEIKDRLSSPIASSNGQIGIAKLKYRDEAIAKSHRATKVFTDATCPVVGDQDSPGELLILVSPPMLENLTQKIRKLGQREARHLTGIESLELRSVERRFPHARQEEVNSTLKEVGQAVLKVRIPNFHLFSTLDHQEMEMRLTEMFGEQGFPYVSFGYFSLYAINIRSMDEAMKIANWQFIDRLELMPMYSALGTATIDIASLKMETSIPTNDLPIVGIVDTGISKGNALDQLVVINDWRIPEAETDAVHGTAVAALVASGGSLTGDTFTPRCRLLNAAIMPSNRGISEIDLVSRLEEILDNHSVEVKHWNISLGRAPGAQPTEFSDLGQILDNFHKRFGSGSPSGDGALSIVAMKKEHETSLVHKE